MRAPDVALGGVGDVNSIPQAISWAARIGWRAWRPDRLRDELFGPGARVCVVHGDTPTALLAAFLARRAGLEVVHLEAGLRSNNVLHPFPEELIRILVMRMSGILFAPNAASARNLQVMDLRGRTVTLPGNTSIDAIATVLADLPEPGSGPAIVSMHRVENLHRRGQVAGFVDLVLRISREHPVRFIVHGPTAAVLRRSGHDEVLARAGVELVDLVPHGQFTRQLAAAPVVVTDGGSVQEFIATSLAFALW